MRLPDLVAYHAAVQHPATAFADPDLRAATITTNRLGLPRVAAGNFALTYQLNQAGRSWAVRCFHRDATDRGRRYAAISQTLASLRGGPFVNIAYLPDGVRVDRAWFPVTKMPWLEGRPLNRAVEARLSSPSRLGDLERRFVELVDALQRLGLAHGDLQHGNILVDPSGALRLVDYDGMFVPALGGMPASEMGDPNYQHPDRKGQFDAHLDRFAALVIVVALRALVVAPHLWSTYNTDDNLLFRRADFEAPDTSALFQDLLREPATRELAEQLARICLQSYGRVPPLADFLNVSPRAPTSVIPAPVLRIADVATLNRLYGVNPTQPGRVTPGQRATRRSWSVRRAAAQHTLAFSPDGELVATADGAGKVRLREAATGRVHHVWTSATPITAIAWSHDGRRLIATGVDGAVLQWSITSKGAARQLLPALSGEVRHLAVGPAGPLLAVARPGSGVTVYDATSGGQLTVSGNRGKVQTVVFSAHGRSLAAATTSGELRCWSLPGGNLVAVSLQNDPVTAVAVTARGNLLASADARGGVHVWVVPGGQPSSELRLPSREAVAQLAFSGDGSLLAAAGRSGRLVIWSLTSHQVVHDFAGPGGRVSAMAFSPDGARIGVTTLTGCISVRAMSPQQTRPAKRSACSAPAVGTGKRVIDAVEWTLDRLRWRWN